jgi:hypothetical protein
VDRRIGGDETITPANVLEFLVAGTLQLPV